MSYPQIKKTWGIPALLAVLILFGLMAALLGTGYWHPIAWVAIVVPLLVVILKMFFQKK